jgi:hypothetical protein
MLMSLGRIALVLDRRLDSRVVRHDGRGMAMIVVLATLAVLSTSIVEYVYNTRVNLYLAQNQRDEVKAYYLARSGVNLQRLALTFQLEIDARGDMMAQMMARSNFQMWRYLPTLAPIFTSGSLSAGDIGAIDLTETSATGFGGLNGSVMFHEIVPEEGKINLNEFASRNIDRETLIRMCALVFPEDFDELMGVEAQRTIEDRFEVIGAIIDHLDPDSDLTEVTEDCLTESAGVGNEISRYLDADWGPKNEPFVSVGELRLVPGVTDAFMDQFEEHFTVYPVTGQFYPNQAGFIDWYGFLCSNILGAQYEGFSMCALPEVGRQAAYAALVLDGYVNFFDDPLRVLMFIMGGSVAGGAEEMLSGGRMIPFPSNRHFVSIADSLINGDPRAQLFWLSFADPRYVRLYGYSAVLSTGTLVPPRQIAQFDTTAMRRAVETGNPRVYTIAATGEYGAASRTVRAVLDLRQYPEERILYWREY